MKTPKLIPIADRVLVKPSESAETKTTGGIIIPDTAKEKPLEGEIIAVGPGRTDDKGNIIKMTVKVGDKVLYSKYGHREIKFEGQEYVIMPENDIDAIIIK